MSIKGKAEVGLIGLAVMGQNLALNLNDHGISLAVYNRTASTTQSFLERTAANRKNISGFKDLKTFVVALQEPRKILLLVKAGEIVDLYIKDLLPLLKRGDLIVDLGNSHYIDTKRRIDDLDQRGIFFLGVGISGGEEGARHGPSLMPGGNNQGWPLIKDILIAISAKTPEGIPCCTWIGPEGSGHFVKMVHNGIEYCEMQLISEVYWFLKQESGLDTEELSQVFSDWNNSLNSFLLEITARIISFKDSDSLPLLEKILDTAGQKGTGKWSLAAALDSGVPWSVLAESVFLRILSAYKKDRLKATNLYPSSSNHLSWDRSKLISHLNSALRCARLIAYAQGFMLLSAASQQYRWQLKLDEIATIWRAGCIIRSSLLEQIARAYREQPGLSSLIFDDYFAKELRKNVDSLRLVASEGLRLGLPLPALASALTFFDSLRSGLLPTNLIQAQRDFFGAHGYERIDQPQGKIFHTDWKATDKAQDLKTSNP